MAMALMLQELNAANFASGNAASGDVLTADGSGGADWQASTGGGASTYQYVALLTQSGVAAPVATILKNTFPPLPEITWKRNQPGYYATSRFVPYGYEAKCTVFFGGTFIGNTPHFVSAWIDLDGALYVVVTSASEGSEDNALVRFPIMVECYLD